MSTRADACSRRQLAQPLAFSADRFSPAPLLGPNSTLPSAMVRSWWVRIGASAQRVVSIGRSPSAASAHPRPSLLGNLGCSMHRPGKLVIWTISQISVRLSLQVYPDRPAITTTTASPQRRRCQRTRKPTFTPDSEVPWPLVVGKNRAPVKGQHTPSRRQES